MSQSSNYGISDIADDGTLKIPLILWAVMIYLSRHLGLVLLGGLSTFMSSRMGVDVSGISSLYSGPLFMLASIPALLVLIASLRRAARAGRVIRTLWRYGRWLLMAAALAELAILIIQVASAHTHIKFNELHLLAAILDLYIVWYLLKSRRARDTFADFPAPD